MKIRDFVLNIHSIIGIFLGLIFVISGLTGSAIVFREEADRALNQTLMQVTPQPKKASIDRIFDSVQQAYPNLRSPLIRFPKTPEDTYNFGGDLPDENHLEVYVNPYTAKVLGSRVWERSFIGFMHTLHYTLFLKKPGHMAMGFVAILLLLTTLTGTLLWTGWRNLKIGFKIRWRAPAPLLNYDLHNVGGILTTIILSILAVTGSAIIAAQFALGGGGGGGDVPAAKPVPERTPIALSKLLPKAEAALPGGRIAYVQFPEDSGNKLVITKTFPEQKTGRFDFSTVEVDRFTGKILKAEKVLEPNPVFKVLLVIVALHFGTFGGVFTRILYVFIGLMPAVLLITGLAMWKRRGWQKVRGESASQLRTEETQSNRLS
ncbi:PepSY-associated TM helix domain-containing protein [Microcoleus sp. AT9b-C5]|uniref:PepSY-associated TM helix domain-containing protein n=1 Tax=unclassified Microcoleus TaxID=2642155 RepID=UPI002FD33BC4